MKSTATTVEQYLQELPEDRREALASVHQAILSHLPEGYEQAIAYGMIAYVVPHETYPAGYHCDPKVPLPFLMLASQKNYMSLYLHGIYGQEALRDQFIEEYNKTGKKLDFGQSYLRFKKVDDLALDVIGKAIARLSVNDYVSNYEATLAKGKKKKA